MRFPKGAGTGNGAERGIQNRVEAPFCRGASHRRFHYRNNEALRAIARLPPPSLMRAVGAGQALRRECPGLTPAGHRRVMSLRSAVRCPYVLGRPKPALSRRRGRRCRSGVVRPAVRASALRPPRRGGGSHVPARAATHAALVGVAPRAAPCSVTIRCPPPVRRGGLRRVAGCTCRCKRSPPFMRFAACGHLHGHSAWSIPAARWRRKSPVPRWPRWRCPDRSIFNGSHAAGGAGLRARFAVAPAGLLVRNLKVSRQASLRTRRRVNPRCALRG